MKAVNWNAPEDPFTKAFWDQNVRQFWVDEEIPLADDKLTWTTLAPEERETYEKVLVGLTLLDTLQGGVGMPLLVQTMESAQVKAVLSFMGAMEQMHAKSYSLIFSTLSPLPRIETLFRWAEGHPLLQAKVARVEGRYRGSSPGMPACTWPWRTACCWSPICSTPAFTIRCSWPGRADW